MKGLYQRPGRVGPTLGAVRGAVAEGGPEVALVVLSKVEQRLDAVRAVLAGGQRVRGSAGVSQQTVPPGRAAATPE